jgi:tetratricopeptide (TPR) repeat protein
MIFRVNGSGFLPRAVFFLFFSLLFSFFLSSQEDIDENSMEIILNDVIQQLAGRNYALALAQFDKLPPENADSPEIILMRASILNSAGRPTEARQLANRVIAADSNNTEALMILADAAKLQDQVRDRRVFLERIIAIDPGHARALNDLGNLALGNRNLFVAANYFDRALAAEPDNGESMVGRAVVARYNREPRRSEQLLNRAANLYPEWARPFQERARLYRGAGFYSDALEDLDEAKRLEPDNYWIILDRGLVLMDMNRKQDALEEFARAIEIDPDVFLAYVYSAGIKDEFGDYEGAVKDYTVLGKLRPDYYFAFEGIGVIKMKNKQWAEARDAFLDAYRQAPKEYTYALLAAVNWMRAGRQTDPRQFLAQVLRTAPRDTHEYALLRLFHDLRGDVEVASKIESEQNILTKARMLFYLASYYDITGSRTLANRYYLMVQELDASACIEWKLNEWILMERGLGLRAIQ